MSSGNTFPRGWLRSVVLLAVLGWMAGCVGSPGGGSDAEIGSAARRRFPLETLPTATVSVSGHAFRVWLALTPEHREEGLMWVTAGELADDQGMLFVFPEEGYQSFWMKNTLIPLDIAFARMDGTIVTIETMPPLTLRNFYSLEPVMFALEVKAGTFARLGVTEGDRLEIPPEVFKAAEAHDEAN